MDQKKIAENNRIYLEEELKSRQILQVNRHSSVDGKWFGPLPEPYPASKTCPCGGCRARFLKK